MKASSGARIEEKVTILTKTFLRYECLNVLLKSIKEKYPEISVLVADDSPLQHMKDIDTEIFPTGTLFKNIKLTNSY